MKRGLAAALVVFGLASPAWAARDAAQEARIDQAVSAVDPALVETLHEANAAADRGDDAAAAKAYALVHERAPRVADVTRRLGTAESRAGDSQDGVRHCREALAADASAENHAALAMALLAAQPFGKGDLHEAQSEARIAARLAPDRAFSQTTLCEIAMAADDLGALQSCSAKLRALAPNAPTTHLFRALVLGSQGDIDGGEQELDRARGAGLDPRAYEHARAALEHARPPSRPVRSAAVGILVGWVALLFLFVVGGMLLGDGLERESSRLRLALERGLIALAAALFYASAAVAVVLGGGAIAFIVLAFSSVAPLPRAAEIALGVFGAYLLVGIGRSVFAKVRAPELGEPLDLAKHESLADLVDRVQTAMAAPALDRVVVRHDAAIEVHVGERNERVLAVGVGALEGLTQRELAALIAAELGRFRRSEAGGELALVELASLDAAIGRMESRGVATDANPAWWFVRIWRAMFARVAEGAIAVQEETSDERAAAAFGKETLERGLRHVAERQVEMAARARASIRDAIEGARVVGLYARPIEDDIRQEIDDAAKAIAERLETIEASDDEPSVEVDDEPAWTLFADRPELERAMAERMQREIHERAGFRLGDQPSSASTEASA